MPSKKYKNTLFFNIKFILLCIFAGIGSALFSIATEKAYIGFKVFYQNYHYWVFLYTPLFFMFIVFMLRRYFPYAAGSGLPQGYALDVYDKPELHATYSLKTMLGKIILTTLSILGGASLGREGPTIQICASIFGSMKNISLQRKKLLIRIGSGVGVATAFNAPLGGLIFAIEEYIKHSDTKMNLLLLTGVAVAGFCTVLICGNYSYLGEVNVSQLVYSWTTIFVAVFAGLICGLSGALFTWLMVYVSVDKGQLWHSFRKKHYIVSACIFGLLVAATGLISNGYSFGNGSLETRDFLNHGINTPWYFGLSKAIGAVFSVAAGVPGGYFSTALSIGAGITDSIHTLWPILNADQFFLLGMVGFLAAITGAPITAIAMVISIVANSQGFVLPIIITALVASQIASKFGDSVYHQQVLIYIHKDKYHKTR